MTLTNDLHLPLPLVEAVRRDSYTKCDCDYSVTELILPPRIAQLRREHAGKLVEDASDRIFSLIGQGIHSILERAAGDRYLVEERFTINHNNGTSVSGRIDLYDKEAESLQDWKITSRFTTADGAKPEWTAQGNLNRLLMTKNGWPVTKIEYVAIYRDWSKMAVARGVKDYPPKQVEVIPIEIWSELQTECYLEERIRLHQEAAKNLPLCSPEERWNKPAKFALMRKGRKRAAKLYETEEQANAAAEEQNKGFPKNQWYVEARKEENTRCQFFCEVLPYCSQGRELVMEAEA